MIASTSGDEILPRVYIQNIDLYDNGEEQVKVVAKVYFINEIPPSVLGAFGDQQVTATVFGPNQGVTVNQTLFGKTLSNQHDNSPWTKALKKHLKILINLVQEEIIVIMIVILESLFIHLGQNKK